LSQKFIYQAMKVSCVIVVSILLLSAILIFDFGIVSTVVFFASMQCLNYFILKYDINYYYWGITCSIQPQVSTAIQILAAILKHLWSEKFQWGITCSIQPQISTAIQILASILKHLWRKNFNEELHVPYSPRFPLPFKSWLLF
jgi:hypothetical protein